MATIVTAYVAENALNNLTIPSVSVSTSGKTITVSATDEDGTATTLATGDGAAAGNVTISNLDWSAVATGFYEVEAVADVGSSNPETILPNSSYRLVVQHGEIDSIA